MTTKIERPKRNTRHFTMLEMQRRIDLACEVLGIHFTKDIKEVSAQRRHCLKAMVSLDVGDGAPKHYRVDSAFSAAGGTAAFATYYSLQKMLEDPEFSEQWEKAKEQYRLAVNEQPFAARRCVTESDFVNNRVDVALKSLGLEREKVYQWMDDGRMTCGKKGEALNRAMVLALVNQRVNVFNVQRFTLAKVLNARLETTIRWETIFYGKLRVQEPELWAKFYERIVPAYREAVVASEAN